MNDTPSQEKPQTQWGPIFQDLIILMAVMGLLGYACNLAMRPFETQTPVDSLVSLIRKGDVKLSAQGQLEDAPFRKELEAVCSDTVQAPNGVNTPDKTGRTPLMWAVYTNFNNPDDTRTKDVERLFYVFALLDSPEIAPNVEDKDGFTALHWAAWSGMRYCAAALAQAGLNVNAREKNGYTPLMLAALRGNAETVELLLALGADSSYTRADGSTALSLATEAKASYDKRDDWKYSLIFSREREAAYAKTTELLSRAEKPELQVPDHAALRQIMMENAQNARNKAARQESLQEEAQENALEQEVRKGAAAPPDTDPAQAPSAQVE